MRLGVLALVGVLCAVSACAADPLCRITWPRWSPPQETSPAAGYHVYRRDDPEPLFQWVASGSAEHEGITVPCAQEGSTWWVAAFRVWTEPPRVLTQKEVEQQFHESLAVPASREEER